MDDWLLKICRGWINRLGSCKQALQNELNDDNNSPSKGFSYDKTKTVKNIEERFETVPVSNP